MSMFHELMMRKKEQIMYATIKGTLTENDGVFSGFSSSSYLALQQSFTLTPTTKAEFVVKVNSSQMNEYSAFMGSYNSIGIVWRINAAEKLTLYVGNGSSWIISDLRGTTNILRNTDYYFRLKIDSGTFTTYLSTDGTNWYQEATTTITLTETYTYNLCLGIGRKTETYFVGSIDLNNSYIKLGSTKYNLQAVVGYTVVGSPTITDGVASGFSGSNYLTLPSFAPEGSWEVCFKVKMGSNVSLAKYFFGSTSYGIVLGNTDTPSGAFKVFLSSNGTSWDIGNLSTGINNPADSIRYVKIGFTGEKYYIEQSEDGITYIGRAELNSTKKIYSVPVRIGNSYEASSRYWQGDIDLNETYIKINNKLWFNGQQA